MAHTKAGGSTRLGRDSQSQRLGVKLFAGQTARPGAIIIRQRGVFYRPGVNVRRGTDDTLFATATGLVEFRKRTIIGYNGRRIVRKFVSVRPA
jgi:large subunit ribosomal protein L27